MATHVAAPAARTADRTSPGRPSSISSAFALWIVEIFVSAASGVLIVLAAGTTRQVSDLPASESGIATGFFIALGVAIAAVALLRVFFTVRMRDGANWARIVLTVLGTTNLFGVVSGGWLSWVAAVITFLAIAAMWVPASQTYFAAAKRR